MILAKAARILALGTVKPAAHAEPTGKMKRVKIEMSKCKHKLVQLTEHVLRCKYCGWINNKR
jgi:hypothetical protein